MISGKFSTPLVIPLLIIICVAMWVFYDPMMLTTTCYRVTHIRTISDWMLALLAGFVHFSTPHLTSNLTFIALAGIPVEATIGRLKTLKALLCIGICSLFFYLIAGPNNTRAFAGASGFLYGLITIFAVLCYRSLVGLYKKNP